jgi:hypothetical protein
MPHVSIDFSRDGAYSLFTYDVSPYFILEAGMALVDLSGGLHVQIAGNPENGTRESCLKLDIIILYLFTRGHRNSRPELEEHTGIEMKDVACRQPFGIGELPSEG